MPAAHEHVYPHIQNMLHTDVRLSERVLPYRGTGDFETDTGHTIQAEGTRVYWATGYIPNTHHIRASKELASCLDEGGFIKVDPTLQVVGAPRIFAGGDCVESKMFCYGERMALFAELHANLCVRQLELLINDGVPHEKLLHFSCPKSGAQVFIVELGKVNAFVQSPGEYDPLWPAFGLQEEANNKLVPSPLANPEHPRYNTHSAGIRIGLMEVPFEKIMAIKTLVGRWSTKEGRAAWAAEYADYAGLLELWTDPTAAK